MKSPCAADANAKAARQSGSARFEGGLLLRSLALVLAVAALPVAAASQQSPQPADAGAIFDRARAVWRDETRPRLLRYDIVVRYTTSGHPVRLTHEALWDRENHAILVKAISDEENESPHTPHGINVAIFAWPLNHEFFEPFGVPELSPFYSFGLAAKPKSVTAVRGTPQPGEPKEIASVAAIGRDYRITLAGEETCEDGAAAYHLVLVPVAKPDQFPLRDLWVRKDDYTTCKLRTARNFSESPVGQGPWEVRFSQTNFGTSISEEHPLEKLTFRKTEIDGAGISFENLTLAHPDVHTDLWRLGLSTTQGDVTREPEER